MATNNIVYKAKSQALSMDLLYIIIPRGLHQRLLNCKHRIQSVKAKNPEEF